MVSFERAKVQNTFTTLFKLENKPFIPTPYQLDIAEEILLKKNKRIVISACTQVGKTFILALVAIVFKLKYPGSKIGIIAPDFPRAKQMMQYLLEHINDHPIIARALPTRTDLIMKRSVEFTKKRISFRDGGDIELMSAHKGKQGLLGKGGGKDLYLVDESVLIDDDTFKGGIMRMLATKPDAILVQIGNPVQINHFYEDFNNPNHKKIRITYKDAIDAGLFTHEFIDEQRKLCGGEDSPLFRMLWAADFVEEATGALIPMSKIMDAIDRPLELNKHATWQLGVDVARFGTDNTVLTAVHTDGEYFVIKKEDIRTASGKSTTETAGRVVVMHRKNKYSRIGVDDIGVGGGVTDTLSDQGLPVFPFNSSNKAGDTKMFSNKKAEAAWTLRQLFMEDRISIPNHPELIRDLQRMVQDYDGQGRIKVVDPPEKSPDYFDSLLIACEFFVTVFGSARGLY